MRKNRTEQIETNNIFPENQVDSEPLINFDDDFSLFFDEPVKALDSEANAEDNKQDELLKLIEESAANSNLTEEQETSTTIFEGENEIPNPFFDPFFEGESVIQQIIFPAQGESHPTNDMNEVPVQGREFNLVVRNQM